MSISCDCDIDYDYYDYDSWFWRHKGDFSTLQTKRRRRCYSCQELIDVGAECGILNRYRAPRHDIEEDIYGDEVPMAPIHMCEECYGLVLSIQEAGGCVLLEDGENLKDAIREWKAEWPEGCTGQATSSRLPE